jgi:hypothetical protein
MQHAEPIASGYPAPHGSSDENEDGHSGVSALRSTADDLVMYQRTIVLRSAATFAAMLLYYYGYLPLWGLILANVLFYPAIYLRVHDIGHSAAVNRFGWSARFVPVANPIWGGTRVFAAVHKEHHKHLGTDRDPWLPYYVGHPLRALFFNLIEPEYSLRQFLRLNGVDNELLRNFVFNAATLMTGVTIFQWTYLIHLINQRIVHGCGIFFFNFYAHRETLSASAPIGTWEREEELRSFLLLFRLLWGHDTVEGLIYHNRHHCVGQQHVPVQNYNRLQDTGVYTQFHDAWPIATIKKL